jgi:hypothetical protein
MSVERILQSSYPIIGGLYELTLKVYPYYRAHNSYGEDEVVINTNGELLSYKHLKTYP